MDKSKYIKEITGGFLKEYGFEYTGSDRADGHTDYSFVRMYNDVRQTVCIDIQGSTIRIWVDTDAFGRGTENISKMLGGIFDPIFHTEEELKHILYHFNNILVQKGFSKLEEMSKPVTEDYARKEDYENLYQNYKELNEKYSQLYQLENIDLTVEFAQRIHDIILENKDKKFKEVLPLLIGLSAVYGEYVNKKCQGEWVWNEKCNQCYIRAKKPLEGTVHPLLYFTHFYRRGKENIDMFLNPFRRYKQDTIL